MRVPEILTERLRLRARARGDIDAIVEMDLHPEVHRFSEMRRDDVPPSRALLRKQVRHRILSQQPRHYWIIEAREGATFLGLVGLGPGHAHSTALSFRLARPVWGRGIAAEASIAVLRHAFLDLEEFSITAFADRANERSHRVLEKIGMTPEGLANLPQRSVLDWLPPAPAAASAVAPAAARSSYIVYRTTRDAFLRKFTSASDVL